MLRYIQPFIILLILFSVTTVSCKKESNTETPASKIDVTLAQTSFHTYEIGLLEAEAGQVFESTSLYINGVEIKHEKADDGTVVFVVPESVGTGTKKLKLIANNREFLWDINILQGAPATANLSTLVADYQKEFSDYRQAVLPLIDSISDLLDTPVVRVPVSDIALLTDSINFAVAQMAQLSPEAQKIATQIIYAQLEGWKEIRALSQDLLVRQQDNLKSLKTGNCTSEWEAECLLYDAKVIISALTVNLRVNARKGALLGLATGLLVSAFGGEPIAVQAGSAAAFLYLGVFTARDVYNAWDELQFSTFNYLVSKFGSEAGSGKKEIELINRVGKDFNYKVVAKNLSSSDKKFNVSWVTSFINVFERFRGKWMECMPEWVSYMPDYAPLLKRAKKLEKLSYLEVVDISNPAVTLESLSGTTTQPTLMFSTNNTNDVSFTFRFKYNDGAFEVLSDPLECVLKPYVDSMALYNNMMPGYWTRYYYQNENGPGTPTFLYSTEKFQFFANGTARLLRYTAIWSIPGGASSNIDNDYSNRSDWETSSQLKTTWEVRQEMGDPFNGHYILAQSGMLGLLNLKTKTADGKWGEETGFIWIKD